MGLETYMSDEGGRKEGREGGNKEGVGSLDSRKTWKWGEGRARIICEDGGGLVRPKHEGRRGVSVKEHNTNDAIVISMLSLLV